MYREQCFLRLFLILSSILWLGGCSANPKFYEITNEELESMLAEHEQADVQPTWWYLGTDTEWHYFGIQYPYKLIGPPSIWGKQTNFRLDANDLQIPNPEPFGQFEVINGEETNRHKRFRTVFYRWSDELPKTKLYDITYMGVESKKSDDEE